MTKLGWSILLLFVVAGGIFISLLSFGPTRRPRPAAATAVVPAPEEAGLLAVPVAGVVRSAIENNWGDPRSGGLRTHHGIDIPAPQGTPVTAAAPGTVAKLFHSILGGTTVYVRSPQRRWTYYYAHLSGYAPGLHEGQVVRAGDPLGYVGDTGDAGPGNYHLHFSLTRTAPDQRWWQGEDVNPYPWLAGTPARR